MGNTPKWFPTWQEGQGNQPVWREPVRTLPNMYPNGEERTRMHAPVKYAVWAFSASTREWYDYAPGVPFDEWEGYASAALYSTTGGVVTLRSLDGKTVYAVFCNGNRVWHALESTP